MRGADLVGADIKGSNIRGADMGGANIGNLTAKYFSILRDKCLEEEKIILHLPWKH